MEGESYTTPSSDRQTPRNGPSEGGPRDRAFVLRRLHSLSGVVPLGVFLIVHLWTNARVLRSSSVYAAGVSDRASIPWLLLEVLGIVLPLGFHVVYGVVLALDSRRKPLAFPYDDKRLFALRATGLLALAFVLFHLGELRAQSLFYGLGNESFYDVLASHLSSLTWGVPLYALAYLGGTAATVFHFVYGMWTYTLSSWGMTASDRAKARAVWAFTAMGVALFALGAGTVISFATGSRFGLGTDVAVSGEPCPAPTTSAKP